MSEECSFYTRFECVQVESASRLFNSSAATASSSTANLEAGLAHAEDLVDRLYNETLDTLKDFFTTTEGDLKDEVTETVLNITDAYKVRGRGMKLIE